MFRIFAVVSIVIGVVRKIIVDEDITGPKTIEELQASGIRGLVDG